MDTTRGDPDRTLDVFAEAARSNPRLPGVQCAWAIASILHHAVERFGRDALFAMRVAEINLPPSEQPWELQARPLALAELRRIVGNYRERNLLSDFNDKPIACQA